MARVSYGGGVIAFRGSIAGSTFQRTIAGNIVRQRMNCARTITPMQSDIHAETYDLSVCWHALPEDAPPLWNTFAQTYGRTTKFGNTTLLSGYAMFLSVNSNRRLLGQTTLDYPPTFAIPTPLLTCYTYSDATANHNYFRFTLTPSPDWICIYTTPPLPINTTSFRKFLRLTTLLEPGEDSGYDLITDWTAVHGLDLPPSAAAGFQNCVMAYTIKESSGLVSPAVFGSTPETF